MLRKQITSVERAEMSDTDFTTINGQRKILKRIHNTAKHKLLLILRRLGIRLINSTQLCALESSGLNKIVARWSQEKVPNKLLEYIFKNYQRSHSQLQQDLVALFYWELNPKKINPFFVEFGATDGITLSNSYLLEQMGWHGLLAEPDKNWHKKLFQTRSAVIDTRCLYSTSGKLVPFRESLVGELSGIVEFGNNDGWSETRKIGAIHEVETVSLEDFLKQNKAPLRIDFLSIDTEGSEFAIIEKFDFREWDIRFVAIEHNFTSSKEKIIEKMSNSGYVQVFPKISAWDAWFLKTD